MNIYSLFRIRNCFYLVETLMTHIFILILHIFLEIVKIVGKWQNNEEFMIIFTIAQLQLICFRICI
jgi:hypothetical protein